MPETQLDLAWVLIASVLVMIMQAGFCLLECGLVRNKNSINVAMKNIADVCVSAAVFWMIGFGLMFGTSHLGLFGTDLFLCGEGSSPKLLAFLLFQTVFCSTAATILSGAVAERMRFDAYLIVTIVVAALIYPVFGHWAWGGVLPETGQGFLAEAGFIDFAGSTVVHSLGGWSALAAIVILGPRLGRFSGKRDGIAGHSLILSAIGTLIIWFGWFGFNGGSLLSADQQIASLLVNTNMGAVFGGVSATLYSAVRYQRPVVERVLNGVIAGLVSVTAGCHVLTPEDAAVCGAIGGILSALSTDLLIRLRVDDAIGAVSAHGVAGAWGTIAVVFLSSPERWGTGNTWTEQLIVQVEGIGLCFGWAVVCTGTMCMTLRQMNLLRISPRGEVVGLNQSEHHAVTELADLTREMDSHRRSGSFHRRVDHRRYTELGVIAEQYNRVLERVTDEIAGRSQTAKRLAEAEEKFRGMFEHAQEGIFQVNRSGQLLLVNRAFANITGYGSTREVLSTIEDAAIDLFDDPRSWGTFTEILEDTQVVKGLEVGIRQADGTKKWVTINARKVVDSLNPCYEGSIVDVSDRHAKQKLLVEKRRLAKLNDRLSQEIQERMEAESNSKQNERKFRSLFDSTRDAILILREDLIIDCNHAAQRLFRSENRHALTQKRLSQFSTQQRAKAENSSAVFQTRIEKAIQEGSCGFDWRFTKLTGEVFPCEVMLTSVVIDGQNMLQATIHDMTDRQRQLEELMAAKEQAQSASRTKTDFLANISHEIRTPLNGILGFTNVLRRGVGDPDRHHEYLETIHSSGQHLLTLINDVLDLTKIESGHMDVEHVDCSPHGVICEVVSILRVMAVEKGLTLDVRWDSEIPETIKTDPSRLRQLLMNLVGNAIKFTEEGSVTIRAAIDPSGNEPRLTIAVIDTGIGIASQNLERIFAPFDQADNSITRRFGGTGLGLAISRSIIGALGGEIHVESELGSGSVFTIRLETGSLEGVSLLTNEQCEAIRQNSDSLARRSNRIRSTLNDARILLCDDGETNRQLIGLVLTEAGAIVDEAIHGRAAVDQVLRSPDCYDMILMDMQMPVLDGYSATAELREHGWKRPIVALTAHAMRGDREKCLDAGCTDYVKKPIDIDQLLDTVAELLLQNQNESHDSGRGQEPELIRSSLPTENPAFRRVVQTFAERLAERLAEMRMAVEQKDHETLGEHVHWLKGAGGTVGFPCFNEPARLLETATKSKAFDECDRLLDTVESFAGRLETFDDEVPSDSSGEPSAS